MELFPQMFSFTRQEQKNCSKRCSNCAGPVCGAVMKIHQKQEGWGADAPNCEYTKKHEDEEYVNTKHIFLLSSSSYISAALLAELPPVQQYCILNSDTYSLDGKLQQRQREQPQTLWKCATAIWISENDFWKRERKKLSIRILKHLPVLWGSLFSFELNSNFVYLLILS